MTRALRRVALRSLGRHPWSLALAVLGIALGVAVAVSIDLANESARRAFALATEAVTGRATHQIVGGPAGISDDLYRALRVDAGVRLAAPVLTGDVAALDHPGRTFTVLGIDPLAEAPFRPYLGGGASDGIDADAGAAGERARPRSDPLAAVAALMTRPGAVLLARPTARELGVRPGDPLRVRVAGARRTLTVVGIVEPADPMSARALASILVADVATAQEIFGSPGRLTRIDLIAPDDDTGRVLLARVAGRLPDGAELVAAGARAGTTGQMIRAFQWNLTALSLLALVVGMFLIYQTTAFSVVQRRPLIGALRAIGVTRGEVFGLVMGEALLIGVVGTAAGLILGLAMARGLLDLVTRTINDLYFVLTVRDVALEPMSLGKGLALGLGATALAALGPAVEATRAAPRAVMSRAALETGARHAVRRATWLGAALFSAGALLLAWPGGGIAGGFAGLFVVMIGCALVSPAAALGLLRLLHPIAGAAFGVLGRLATRGIAAALSRTAVAIAALTIAVSAAIGVGVMIASFREAVVRWLEGTLRADIYVSAPSLVGSRPDATLDPDLAARLAATPGVMSVSTSRGVMVAGPGGPVQVVALDLDPARRPRWRFREGGSDGVWDAGADAVIVSEPYANRHGARAGGTVRLRTDRGEREFRVAGVFYDYGSSAGVVVMSRRAYDRAWDDRRISSLAADVSPGADPEGVMAAMRDRAGGQDLVIRSNRALREGSLAIFDRTFAITGVLRTLTVVVAFIGVLAALMALGLERAREVGVLRTLGLTPRQVWVLLTAQSGLMGLIAGVLAVPGGLLLAWVLVFVINRRSFGWTMPLSPSPSILLQGIALSVLAAVLAGLYPAWRMAAALPADAVRDE